VSVFAALLSVVQHCAYICSTVSVLQHCAFIAALLCIAALFSVCAAQEDTRLAVCDVLLLIAALLLLL